MQALDYIPESHREEEGHALVSGSCGLHSGNAHAHEEALREASFLKLLAKRRREAGDEAGAEVAERRSEEITRGE